MESITRINGNGKKYTTDLPKLVITSKYMNDGALAHIKENTGLDFIKTNWNYEVQPESSNQIAILFLTYNFKTRYYDNSTFKNELHLKSDHHIGYNVESICLSCVERNHIHTNGLEVGDFLSC